MGKSKEYQAAYYAKRKAAKSGGIRKISNDLSNKNIKEVEKIRNAKRENLIIMKENGEIIHSEGGNTNHVGTGNASYEGNIAIHNHPTGKALPYPSTKDFDTFEKTKLKMFSVVSPDYTITVRRDPNDKRVGHGGITHYLNYTLDRMQDGKLNNQRRKGEISYEEYRKKKIELHLKAQKEACKRAGYEMTITKH